MRFKSRPGHIPDRRFPSAPAFAKVRPMMKTTHQWLDAYVRSGLSPQQMAEKLTLAGTEVEHMQQVGDDTCFTLEVTSNRVDCLGALGLARELAACLGKEVVPPAAQLRAGSAKAASIASVTIEPAALKACPYYTAHVIRGVKVGPSPEWLRKRLEAIGLKPVNNIVDITNFVLFETSQPLHAFDLGRLQGRRIVVRMARDKEAFRPIADRKQRASIALDPRTLVIADAENAQAVAGVMGGADSEVGPGTTDILLESAYFEPAGNKATSQRLELESDSCYRFQRGVDMGGVLAAARRAAALIVEVAGGEVLEGVLEAGSATVGARQIHLEVSLVQQVVGAAITRAEIERIFRGLGLGIAGVTDSGLTVNIPSFRRDLEKPIDLVEEVARVWGLDRVPAPLRLPVAMAKPTRRQRVRGLVRRALLGQGCSEALTDTFVSAEVPGAAFSVFSAGAARLEARNPVNAELPALRRNLMGSMLLALQTNQRHGSPVARLFEVANVFHPAGGNSGERELVALLGADFLDLKGTLEGLLEDLRTGGNLRVEPLADPFFAPGRAARLHLGERLLGVLGEPAAVVLKHYQLEGACAVAELDLDVLVQAWTEVPEFRELPRFPTAERDLAVVLDATRAWSEVEATVRAAADATLREVRLFDEFRGKQVGEGRKSLAFRLYLRHDERTLTSDEIERQVGAVVAALKAKLGGELRA